MPPWALLLVLLAFYVACYCLGKARDGELRGGVGGAVIIFVVLVAVAEGLYVASPLLAVAFLLVARLGLSWRTSLLGWMFRDP